ncbi:MAG: T9SS type A sorting domain-containing protein [Candidatus Electryonea clarkiae]|nr:T9SS type A sorting domain-containing protein [Candidatus Electryonea clarkiae]MDP8285245.1 T9SS type A sorting domain-containing protein [Candidatus Electryonea clarkiae]
MCDNVYCLFCIVFLLCRASAISPVQAATLGDTLFIFANNDLFMDVVTVSGDFVDIRYMSMNGTINAEPNLRIPAKKPVSTIRYAKIDPAAIPKVEVVHTDGSTDELDIQSGEVGWHSSRPSSKQRRLTINDMPFQRVFRMPANRRWAHPWQQSVMMDVDGDGMTEWLYWWKYWEEDTTAYLNVYRNHEGDSWQLDHVFTNSYPSEERYQKIGFYNLCAGRFFHEEDLVEIYFFSGDNGWLWEFTGPGEFDVFRTNVLSTKGCRSTTVADFNQDGRDDITAIKMHWHDHYTAWDIMTHQIGDNIHWNEDPPFVGSDGLYNYGEIYRGWSATAVGDFDHDGQNEVALNYIPGGFPTINDVECYYMDFDEDGTPHMETFITEAPGYQNKPLIADLDGDGLDEWLHPGVVVFPDGSRDGIFRVIEADENGELQEVYLDTSFTRGAQTAIAFGSINNLPTVAMGTNDWYYNYPLSMYSVISYDLNRGYFLQDYAEPDDLNMLFKSIYLNDYDDDGFTNMSFYSTSEFNRLAVYEETDPLVSVPDFPQLPDDFEIGKPFPNPFNSEVSIVVDLTRRESSSIDVFNVNGQKVAGLEVPTSPGMHRVVWNAKGMSSGTYFMKWSLKPEVTRMAVLLK